MSKLRVEDLPEFSSLERCDMETVVGGKRSKRGYHTAAGSVNVEPPTALTAGSLPTITVEEETQIRSAQLGSGFLGGFASGSSAGSVS